MDAKSLARGIKRYQVAFYLTLLLALALRLVALGEMSLRADEAANLVLATGSPGEIIRPFLNEDPHMPLYFLVLHYWMQLAGQTEFAARFLTVLASVALVAIMGALGNFVFPERKEIAFVGTLLAAANPYLIWDAQDLHLYPLWAPFALGSWFVFQWAIERQASWRAWLGYVLITATAFYLHYFTALVLAAQGLVALFLAWRNHVVRPSLLAFLVAVVGVVLLFLPWLILALPMLAGFQTDFYGTNSLSEMVTRSLTAFAVGRVDDRLMAPMLDSGLAVLLMSGYAGLALLGLLTPGAQDQRRWAQALYLCVPLFAIQLFASLRFSIFDERYVIFLTPVFLLFVARGIVHLFRWSKWLPACAVLLALMASAYTLNNYFRVPAFAKSPDWHGFVQHLSAEAIPGDVIVQNYPDPALPYYLQNRIPRILLPHTSTESAETVEATLSRVSSKYSRIWLQPVPGGAWDRDGLVETWLDRYAHGVNSFKFRGLQLSLYVPGAIAAQSAVPVNATFQGEYQLLAFESAALSDAKVAVVLYWEALKQVARDATVYVHLYDDEGKLQSQQDNAPVGGTFPTTEWRVGQVVVDPYVLQLPSQPINLRLVAGMYDTETRARLNAADELGQPVPDSAVLLSLLGGGGPR